MALTPRTKKVFEFAVEEAQRLNHRFIGTEHLLLGLIREGEGIAAGVLKSFGLQLEQVRTETLRVLRQQQQGQEEAPAIPSVPSEATTLLAEDEPGLTCTSCGAHCPGYFRYCFNCGQPLIHEEESSHGQER
jgi:ATP-dependent Clp protease ATP-binding subunit ClpC